MQGRAISNSRQSSASGRRCASPMGAKVRKIARSPRSGRLITSSITGRMRKNGCKAKEPGFPIDFCGLDNCDLMPAKALADDVKAARQRGVAEGAVALTGERGADG